MGWKHTLPQFALIVALVLAPLAASAQSGAPPCSGGDQETSLQPGSEDPATALGALAAIGCGIMVRATIITGGTQVGTIAGAIASCGYMLLDAFILDRN